jgi:hypothetical protein
VEVPEFRLRETVQQLDGRYDRRDLDEQPVTGGTDRRLRTVDREGEVRRDRERRSRGVDAVTHVLWW